MRLKVQAGAAVAERRFRGRRGPGPLVFPLTAHGKIADYRSLE